MGFALYTLMRREKVHMIEASYQDAVQRSIRQCLHLLAKSYERYGMLKASKAPKILVDAEEILICQRLLALFNFHAGLTK